MVVQFAMWGNSVALRIPHVYAKELHADPGCSADITVQDGKLIVTPVTAPTYTLEELVAGITEENLHGEVSTGAVAVGNEFGS